MVLSLLHGSESQAELARRHDVSATMLSRWRDQFVAAGEQGLRNENRDPSRDARVELLEQELGKRDQIIGELTIANRLLKKGFARI
jgi:transposase-like protein